MKKWFLGLLVVGGVLVAVVLLRAFLHTPVTTDRVEPVVIALDEPAIAERLAQAIRFRTISHQSDEGFEQDQFTGFINWVKTSYPEVNSRLTLTLAGDYTMLYHWAGSDPSLQPVLLTGHYDVVPVIPGTEDKWTHPPYAGVIQDNVIWGRGALDDKSAVIAQLEAATRLLQAGYAPA